MTREKMNEISLLLLRVVSGLLFMQAGGSKLFGWFGSGAGGDLPALMMVAGTLEFFGGIAIIFGLFTRYVAFILSGLMASAFFIAHFPKAFWPAQNGGVPAVLFCFIFLFFAAHGAGKWSLDQKMSERKQNTSV